MQAKLYFAITYARILQKSQYSIVVTHIFACCPVMQLTDSNGYGKQEVSIKELSLEFGGKGEKLDEKNLPEDVSISRDLDETLNGKNLHVQKRVPAKHYKMWERQVEAIFCLLSTSSLNLVFGVCRNLSFFTDN